MNEEQLNKLNKLSDQDLEHYANGELDKMSDQGLEILAQGPGSAPKPGEGQDKGGLPDLLSNLKGFASGALNEGSFNYIPKDVFQNESPTATNLGRVVGALATGAGIGKLASKAPILARLVTNPAGRLAANATLSGGIGAARNPHEGETRSGNALNDMLFGTGLSVAGETLQAVPPLARFIGRTMSGLSPAEAEAFRQSPGSSELLFKAMDQGGSDKISDMLQEMLKGSKQPGRQSIGLQGKIQSEVIDPATRQKQLYLGGDADGVRVNTADIERASPEVRAVFNDMVNKQMPFPRSRQTATPLQLATQYEGEASQVGLPLRTREEIPGKSLGITAARTDYNVQQQGLPFTEKAPLPTEGRYSYPRPPNRPIELGQTIESGGFQEQLPLNLSEPNQIKFTPIDSNSSYGRVATQEQLGLPLVQRGSEMVPQSKPKTVVLTLPQADRLRATAWESARARERAAKLNPVGSDPFLPEDAQIATSMRSAVEAQRPRVAPLNEQIYNNINKMDAIDELGSDLSTLLKSDGKQDLIRSYYDRNTGSKLNLMANQYEAGKKLYGNRQASLMNIPSLLSAVGGQPVSRALIRTPMLPPGLTGMSALQAILRGTEAGLE